MPHSDTFNTRLTQILDYYGLSASAFADLIGVQRSSISHIMSGRNKPSLDFLLKLNMRCPDINLHWFLNGNGSITEKNAPLPTPKTEINSAKEQLKTIENNSRNKALSTPIKHIERIVLFYNDGSFESFSN